MYQLSDVVRFKKELYFDGAVQIDWFYNKEKQAAVAKSFVFHGPEYFGIDEDDVDFKSHKLLDTASYTNILANKIYDENALSNFFLTIAPYGTGKSHLSVTLASLFSGDDDSRKSILKNMQSIDSKIANSLQSYSYKPNLVLVLNGMRDFNLNYEILNATQKVLDLHKVDNSFLKSLTKSYDIAKKFVVNTFDKNAASFEKYAEQYGVTIKGARLKDYLINNILSETDVYEIVNNVYFEMTSTYIRWDEGISAGDILTCIAENLCGDKKPFNKVIVFFDEFGRFIEFASTYPTKAGDAALQQIYEAVQNNDGQIIFLGFIQSDLKSYLTRVERTANINRYVGRYEASEKIYLSSNLETIFANLIERKNKKAFDELVKERFKKNTYEWKEYHQFFINWAPSLAGSSVWSDYNRFQQVVLEGIFPFHPLTSFMMSNLSSWLQQRSALTFLESQINDYGGVELTEFGDLPLIPATRIVRTAFFNELLSAEQEGRKQSEYCILYNQILTKHGDKFDERLRETLAAILISRIGRFRTKSLNETKQLLNYASNLSSVEIKKSLDILENTYGVISYDDIANVYDFVEDAVGIKDFKLLISKKKKSMHVDLSLFFDTGITEVLNLSDIETSFAGTHMIKTAEWKFKQQLMHIDELNLKTLGQIKLNWQNAVSPDTAKGQLFWLYIPQEVQPDKIDSISKILKREGFDDIPVIFNLLDDHESKFYDTIVDYYISKTFSKEEITKYNKFIRDFEEKSKALVIDTFKELGGKRQSLTGEGIEKNTLRITHQTNQLFEKIYSKVISFPFHEFSLSKSGQTKGKTYLSRLGRILVSNSLYSIAQSESKEVKNRLEVVLFEGSNGSWEVINKDYRLIPPKNHKVATIFYEWDQLLAENKLLTFDEIYSLYQKPPYGINDYALALLLSVYLAQRTEDTRIAIDDTRIRLEEWALLVFEDKKVNLTTILDSKMVKIDPEQSAGKYLNLFKRVINNTDVEVAYNLEKEFKELMQQEEVPTDIEDKVVNIEFRLKEGMKYYKYAISKFGEIRERLSEASKDDRDMKKIFYALDSLATVSGNISDSNWYVYNPKQLEEADQLEKLAHKIIDKIFPTYLQKLKCQSYAQVTGFEKWAKGIADNLYKYGYKEEASKLNSKIEEAIARVNPVVENIENFIAMSKPNYQKGYTHLMTVQEQAKGHLKKLDLNKKVKPTDKKELVWRINEFLVEVENQLNLYKEEVAAIYDDMYDIQTFEQCEEFLMKMKNILSKDIQEMDKEGIEEAANHTQNFIFDVKNLLMHSQNRFEFDREWDNLHAKWTEIEFEINFVGVLDGIKERNDLELEVAEGKWIASFLVTDEVNEWSVNECTQRLNVMKNLPNYLTSSAISKVKESEKLILARLKELNIEAVVEMFKQLSDTEKQVALKEMNSLINLCDHYVRSTN